VIRDRPASRSSVVQLIEAAPATDYFARSLAGVEEDKERLPSSWVPEVS
jgi:hypothetical protein